MTDHRQDRGTPLDMQTVAAAAPAPDRRCYVVGDVHGCRDKLLGLLDKIARDRGTQAADIVFLGDYVDRGPDSAGVLADLHDLQRSAPDRVVCLAGNHDRMMLNFLDAPDRRTGRWLAVGGMNTLASFGALPDALASEKRLADIAAAAREAMGPDLIGWLRGLPLWWRSGNLIAVHALTDPALPMEQQLENTLLWARPGDGPAPRDDGCWVIHGHTMVARPWVGNNHIAVDTGAFRGNPLTAAVLDGEGVRFLQAD